MCGKCRPALLTSARSGALDGCIRASRIRVLTREEIKKLRVALRATTQLGQKVTLMSLQEVARVAGCARETIRRRMGHELPAGRWITQPRGTWAFTSAEVRPTVAWVRRHLKQRRRQRAPCRS